MAVELVDPRRALEVVPRDLRLPCCDRWRVPVVVVVGVGSSLKSSSPFVTMIPTTVHSNDRSMHKRTSMRINSLARLRKLVTRIKNGGSQHLAHSPSRHIPCAWICGSFDDAGWGAHVRGNRGVLLVGASPRHLAANITTRALISKAEFPVPRCFRRRRAAISTGRPARDGPVEPGA